MLRPRPAHAPVPSPKAALLLAVCAPAAALRRSLPRSFKLLHPISSLTTPPLQLLRSEPQRVRRLGGVDSGWRAGLCAGGHVQWSAHLRHAGHAAAAGKHGAGTVGWLAARCCQTMSRLLRDAWAAAQNPSACTMRTTPPRGPYCHVPPLSKLLLLPPNCSGASRPRLQQRPAGAARRLAPARQQSKLADHLHPFLVVTYLRPVTAPTRFEGVRGGCGATSVGSKSDGGSGRPLGGGPAAGACAAQLAKNSEREKGWEKTTRQELAGRGSSPVASGPRSGPEKEHRKRCSNGLGAIERGALRPAPASAVPATEAARGVQQPGDWDVGRGGCRIAGWEREQQPSIRKEYGTAGAGAGRCARPPRRTAR